MEVRLKSVQRSLNPEAPEFFPRSALVSAPNLAIFSPVNMPFPQYQTLPSPTPPAFSAPRYCCPFYYTYCHQDAVHYPDHLTPDKAAYPDHLTPDEAAFAPVTEPVSSLLEPMMTKMVLEDQAAQEPTMMVGPKGNMGGSRRKKRDQNKPFWRFKRYGKQGCIRADHSPSRKKEWRTKAPNICDKEDRHFGRNAEVSFEYPRKIQGWVTNNKNREKHPPIPLKSDGNETTVMIRNIPNRYTREMLKDMLDQHCKLTNQEAQHQNAGAGEEEAPSSAFDFLYLPIDFVTKSNKGYAFVNFTNPGAARKFFDAWHDEHWDCFHSNKIREIYCAKLQGMEQLLKNFEKMEFPSEDFQPVRFNPARDGSGQSVEETRVGRCTNRL